MDRLPASAGGRFLALAYTVVAVKRVRGMRLLGPAWKNANPLATAPVPLANKAHQKTGHDF
jgi:hypothetical protein